MFEVTSINMGDICEGEQRSFMFPYKNIRIKQWTHPCDCSLVTNDTKNSRLVIDYTAPEIPIHLLQRGNKEASVRKQFLITYCKDDSELEENVFIEFYGTIKRKL